MSGRAALALGLGLIALGILLLVREVVPGLDVGNLWPWASIAFGVILMVLSVRRVADG